MRGPLGTQPSPAYTQTHTCTHSHTRPRPGMPSLQSHPKTSGSCQDVRCSPHRPSSSAVSKPLSLPLSSSFLRVTCSRRPIRTQKPAPGLGVRGAGTSCAQVRHVEGARQQRGQSLSLTWGTGARCPATPPGCVGPSPGPRSRAVLPDWGLQRGKRGRPSATPGRRAAP